MYAAPRLLSRAASSGLGFFSGAAATSNSATTDRPPTHSRSLDFIAEDLTAESVPLVEAGSVTLVSYVGTVLKTSQLHSGLQRFRQKRVRSLRKRIHNRHPVPCESMLQIFREKHAASRRSCRGNDDRIPYAEAVLRGQLHCGQQYRQ